MEVGDRTKYCFLVVCESESETFIRQPISGNPQFQLSFMQLGAKTRKHSSSVSPNYSNSDHSVCVCVLCCLFALG
jgi:hypothetical protein